MFQINGASAACIALAMLGSGLSCSPPSDKAGGDGTQTSSNVGAANTPANSAATNPPPAGDKTSMPADALSGSKNDASVKDSGVVEAANFACTAEQDALKAEGHPQVITLVEITAATSQVVEGVSYGLTLHVKLDGQDRTADAVVWARPWQKDDKLKLTSWKFADNK